MAKDLNKIMKIVLMICAAILIVSALTGCSKTYSIRVYSSGINKYELQKAEALLAVAKLAKSEALIIMVEEEIRQIENTPDKVETYRASKIIESSSTSVRFIDKEGKEQFISGKKIEIQEITQ